MRERFKEEVVDPLSEGEAVDKGAMAGLKAYLMLAKGGGSRNETVAVEINEWRESIIRDLLISDTVTFEAKSVLANLPHSDLEFLTLKDLDTILRVLPGRLDRLEKLFCEKAIQARQPELIIQAVSDGCIREQDGRGLALEHLLGRLSPQQRDALEKEIRVMLKRWLNPLTDTEVARRVKEGYDLDDDLGSTWQDVVRAIKESIYWEQQILEKPSLRNKVPKPIIEALLRRIFS